MLWVFSVGGGWWGWEVGGVWLVVSCGWLVVVGGVVRGEKNVMKKFIVTKSNF